MQFEWVPRGENVEADRMASKARELQADFLEWADDFE